MAATTALVGSETKETETEILSNRLQQMHSALIGGLVWRRWGLPIWICLKDFFQMKWAAHHLPSLPVHSTFIKPT
jgi:hypothetical protein